MGEGKVGVGVMTKETSLEMVRAIAHFTKNRGSKLMMLWSLTRDLHACSNEMNGTWLDNIRTHFLDHGDHSALLSEQDNILYEKIKSYHSGVRSLREFLQNKEISCDFDSESNDEDDSESNDEDDAESNDKDDTESNDKDDSESNDKDNSESNDDQEKPVLPTFFRIPPLL